MLPLHALPVEAAEVVVGVGGTTKLLLTVVASGGYFLHRWVRWIRSRLEIHSWKGGLSTFHCSTVPRLTRYEVGTRKEHRRRRQNSDQKIHSG